MILNIDGYEIFFLSLSPLQKKIIKRFKKRLKYIKNLNVVDFTIMKENITNIINSL